MPVPAYVDIGKASKDLLYGGKAGGAFVLDPKLSFSSKTSAGVTFATTFVKKGEKLEPTLKTAYSSGFYSVDATIDASEKIALNASISETAPGLKINGSVIFNDLSTAKVGVDYVIPYLNLKSVLSLNSAPVVDLAVSTGYQAYLVGGEASYSTAKSAISKWGAAFGYHAADFQLAASVSDFGNTLKVAYAHNVTPTQVVAAEVSHKFSTSSHSLALGYQRKLENGAISKLKIDNAGLVSLLYETKLATGEKVAGAFQLQATDLSKPVKYGFSIDFL